ncbi:NADPH-dependent 7-cyano-7-deazaguanine reductase QueF [candidate division WOR-3 bacterium]|nr:NADPH-dependent 7-cyano-7-deazaguanine reductase QueF [candidate division WOR-3 bacterium]
MKKHGEDYRKIEVPVQGELTILKNPVVSRTYTVEIEALEFTCLCPMTGQPDYAVILIHYCPKDSIFELKSLKLYLQTFRQMSLTHEEAVNAIFDKIEKAVQPLHLEVRGQFSIRGGIRTSVTARSGSDFSSSRREN